MPLVRPSYLWLLLAAALLAACGKAVSERSEAGGVAARSIEVVATDMAYEPATLTLAAGEPVRVRLVNQGALEHDWTVGHDMVVRDVQMREAAGSEHHREAMGGAAEDVALHLAVAPGQSVEATFTPTAAGDYEFYCTVPGHREAGMIGTMVVQ